MAELPSFGLRLPLYVRDWNPSLKICRAQSRDIGICIYVKYETIVYKKRQNVTCATHGKYTTALMGS
jgi:hypothetical protein